MRNAFVESLLKEAKNNSKILLLTGDLGYGVLDRFSEQIPEQFFNFGINEQSMMSAAAGLAAQGFKPFIYSIGNFPTFRCLEQIRNDVCYMNLDVSIVAVGAGFAYGTAGYSHHLIEDFSAMSVLPNITIFNPADPSEARGLVKYLVQLQGPKYVRLGKGGEENLLGDFEIPMQGVHYLKGKSKGLIVSSGNILVEVIKAKKLLEKIGYSPSLVSFSCLNKKVLLSFLDKYSDQPTLTVEEHLLRGGLGSQIKELQIFQNKSIKCVGIQEIDSSISGSQEFLRKHYSLDAESIKKKFLELLG